jgi:hypothetical protein
MGVSHVDHTLEESSFLGTTMIEEDQRVLNRHNAVVNALKNKISVSEEHHPTSKETHTFSNSSRQLG